VILGVDAMDVEPYPKTAKRLLLPNHIGLNFRPGQFRKTEGLTQINKYRLVYCLMPFSPFLPNLVVSLISHEKRKSTSIREY
jgi:hypothetical protein